MITTFYEFLYFYDFYGPKIYIFAVYYHLLYQVKFMFEKNLIRKLLCFLKKKDKYHYLRVM